MADNTISYNTVVDVSTSWDRLKRVKNYQTITGDLILDRLFNIAPSAKQIFNFSDDEDIYANPRYSAHAKAMVNMIDIAVSLLGPDLDLLKDDLARLGRRHKSYGVEAKYLPTMETAVIYVLEEILGDRLSSSESKSWKLVLDFMVAIMIREMQW